MDFTPRMKICGSQQVEVRSRENEIFTWPEFNSEFSRLQSYSDNISIPDCAIDETKSMFSQGRESLDWAAMSRLALHTSHRPQDC